MQELFWYKILSAYTNAPYVGLIRFTYHCWNWIWIRTNVLLDMWIKHLKNIESWGFCTSCLCKLEHFGLLNINHSMRENVKLFSLSNMCLKQMTQTHGSNTILLNAWLYWKRTTENEVFNFSFTFTSNSVFKSLSIGKHFIICII